MPSEHIPSQFFLTDEKSRHRRPINFTVVTDPAVDALFENVPISLLPFASLTLPPDEGGVREIVVSGEVSPDVQPLFAYREWLDKVKFVNKMTPSQIEMEMSRRLSAADRATYLLARRSLLKTRLRIGAYKTPEKKRKLEDLLNVLENIK